MMHEATKEIRDLLRTNMGSRCKVYYLGRPFVPAKLALPALFVSGITTKHERPNTAQDIYRFSIRITVIQDLAAAQNIAGLADSMLLADENIQAVMEEADTTGAPKIDTVLGCLMRQRNIRGTNFIYNFSPQVNYEPNIAHMQGYWYVAAQVTMDIVTDIVPRTQ